MRVGALGPLMVWTGDGEPLAVTGARARRLLARLLVEPGRPVSADRLVDALWGGPDAAMPRHPYASLQGQVSRLRAALGRAAPADGRSRLVHDASGYRLDLASGELDAQRFAELVARSRRRELGLARSRARRARPARARPRRPGRSTPRRGARRAPVQRTGRPLGPVADGLPPRRAARDRGRVPAASRLHEEGLAIAQELGLRTEAGKRLCALGRPAFLAGAYEESRQRHAEALRLAGEQSHRAGEADARIGLGMVARRTGDLAGAEEHMQAVLTWFRDAGYAPGTTLALAELGFTAELWGDADRARALQTEGLAAARALGDVRAVALALEGVAGAAAAGGDPERAATLLGAAHTARTSVGAPLPPAERHDVDRTWSARLSALGPAAADAAFARGTAHPPDA
ncbi:tetratricopeptide repeat protein [Streptomyces sp. NPDC088748]|uniref:AfsR/SARP family transcriptional regulator n=1 Tax=Streptomyces sp. NPDC088748 TaxID=3365887 RepID=UPI003800E1E8